MVIVENGLLGKVGAAGVLMDLFEIASAISTCTSVFSRSNGSAGSEVIRVGSRVPGPADGSEGPMAFDRLEHSDEAVGGGEFVEVSAQLVVRVVARDKKRRRVSRWRHEPVLRSDINLKVQIEPGFRPRSAPPDPDAGGRSTEITSSRRANLAVLPFVQAGAVRVRDLEAPLMGIAAL